MKGNPDVIKALQAAAAMEAHLNLQYRLDARSLQFMGLKKTARHFEKYGDDAHDFLKCVTKRILFLEGDPSYQIDKVQEQKSVTELFDNAHSMETGIAAPYEKAIQTSMKALDDATRNLFEHLIKWHEQHIGWIETQQRLIEGLGEEAYIEEKL